LIANEQPLLSGCAVLPCYQVPYPQLVERGRIPKTAVQHRKAQAGAGKPFELSELGKLVLGTEAWPAPLVEAGAQSVYALETRQRLADAAGESAGSAGS
jgi:hypothetical protein